MKIHDFIPPVLLNLTRRIGMSDKYKTLLSKPYSSYEDAILACGKTIFSDDEYARLMVYKTKMFRNELDAQTSISLGHSQLLALVGILLSAQQDQNKILRVIDVGGASGTQYFLLKRFLKNSMSDSLKIYWHVVETVATVQASKELENDELRFFSSISNAREELKTVDLVYASSVLQCLPDPKKSLEEIIQCEARFVYLGSIGLTLEETKVIALHKASFLSAGPKPFQLPEGVENKFYKVPFTFMPKKEFDEILEEKYSVEVQIHDNLGIFDVPGKNIVGYSILAQKHQR